VGKEVRCWVREPVDGRTEFLGRLVGASDTTLAIEEPEGSTRELPRALVTKARLVPSFGRPGQARRK
jgi:ribosome maturation factor RimP